MYVVESAALSSNKVRPSLPSRSEGETEIDLYAIISMPQPGSDQPFHEILRTLRQARSEQRRG